MFATLFYVGEESVLVMDPLEHCYEGVMAAIESVTAMLRPKYGRYYGFDAGALANAELAVFTVFAFR